MRIIAHLDMDAFFAAVEERDRPRLRGLPIVVGADPKDGQGRGVVSTANYKAREYGIRSAMPISEAWRRSEEARRALKPPAVFLGGSFKKYGEVSDRIMAIVRKRSPQIQEVSIDEAYMDLSHLGSYEKAKEACRALKAEIREKEKLTASVGIGPNKLIAKIASDREKPDGLTVVEEKDAEKFLEPLSIRVVPGIGPKTEEFFARKGIREVKGLKKFSKSEMEEMLGKWGAVLYEKARGRDDSSVAEDREVKSVGEQETFMEDAADPNFVSERLRALAETVIRRFKKAGFKAFGRVVVTVRFADFETLTRSVTLEKPARDREALAFEATRLLLPFFDKRGNPRKKKIRLVGVRVEKLSQIERRG